MTNDKSEILYVGIDGGGTKCRVRIETSTGVLLGIGLGGTANPSHGLSTVVNSIMSAINIALEQANLTQHSLKNLVVGAGLAGLHLPKYIELMSSWQHPFKAFYLTDDLHVATLGAHAGGDGAVAIVGTGFSALSIVNNTKTAIGGYGFLQADHCSGSWIGYQAVQAVLLAQDKLAEPTQLTELLVEKFQAQGVDLANKLVGASACDYGTIAPLVFIAAKNNDPTSLAIIKQSCEFIQRVIQVLAATNPPKISLIGGIAEQVMPLLEHDVVSILSLPIKLAEQGAIYFAHQQHQLVSYPAAIQSTAMQSSMKGNII